MDSVLLLLDLCHKAGLMRGYGMKQIIDCENDWITFEDGTKTNIMDLYYMLKEYLEENSEA